MACWLAGQFPRQQRDWLLAECISGTSAFSLVVYFCWSSIRLIISACPAPAECISVSGEKWGQHQQQQQEHLCNATLLQCQHGCCRCCCCSSQSVFYFFFFFLVVVGIGGGSPRHTQSQSTVPLSHSLSNVCSVFPETTPLFLSLFLFLALFSLTDWLTM